MQTEPQITFKNMEVSAAVEAIVRRRIAGLELVHDNIIGCRVVIEVPHRRGESGKMPLGVAVEVTVPGRPTIVAKDEQERHAAKQDQMAPVNNAFDAIERQLEKLADIRAREVHGAVASEAQTGMVVRLFPEQGYGFVEVDHSTQLHFTRHAVLGDGFDDLKPGMLVHVIRANEEGPMGPQANSIRLLDKATTPSSELP
jgi:ribosome-associated translation inhibitor RaiA/cold shock CspA family protein